MSPMKNTAAPEAIPVYALLAFNNFKKILKKLTRAKNMNTDSEFSMTTLN